MNEVPLSPDAYSNFGQDESQRENNKGFKRNFKINSLKKTSF